MFTPSQCTAHHTAGSHTEEIIHGVECKHQRCHQSDGGILNGVVKHSHKVGIRQIIDYGDQGAYNGRYDKLPYGGRD